VIVTVFFVNYDENKITFTKFYFGNILISGKSSQIYTATRKTHFCSSKSKSIFCYHTKFLNSTCFNTVCSLFVYCHVASARRQRRNLYGLRAKLPPITTSPTIQR